MSKPFIPDYPRFHCEGCGKFEELYFYKTVQKELHEAQLCFHCHHWQTLFLVRDREDVTRVNRSHYMRCPDDNRPWAFRGFGGSEFVIRYADGRTAVTHNLWCQGRIPDRLCYALPDNAEFVAR